MFHLRGEVLVIICILIFALSGCGQKGDLYLPDQTAGYNQQQ